MRIHDIEVTYPRVLLLVLASTILITTIIGLSTSSAAFGSYNPAWEGTSDLRELTTTTGGEPEIEQSTAVYQRQEPTSTTAFIISPTESYSPTATDRIDRFLKQGGTVILAADFHPAANRLLEQLNTSTRFDGRLLRDERQYYRGPSFPIAEPSANATITQGVSQLTLNHGTAVTPDANSTAIVNSSGYAYFDTNRNGQLDDSETLRQRPVVVQEPHGDGTLLVVSDPSLFINAMLDVPDNQQFARNLLSGSDVVIFDYSHRAGIPWAVALVLTVAETPLLQFLVVTILVGLAGAVWLRGWWPGESWGSSTQQQDIGVSHSELVDRLTTRHPDWDDARVDRVATGIMSDDPKGDSND